MTEQKVFRTVEQSGNVKIFRWFTDDGKFLGQIDISAGGEDEAVFMTRDLANVVEADARRVVTPPHGVNLSLVKPK